MPVKPRTLAYLVFAALVVTALLYVTMREEPVPVDLVEVTQGPMEITINADGKTEIRNLYEVAAPIAGTVERSLVEVGDMVVAGETVVAVMEPAASALLDPRSRGQAEAAVREAEAALDVADAQLRQATEDLAYAQSQFGRAQTLVNRGVASITQLEDVTQRLAIKEAARDTAQSQRAMAEGALDRARAALIEPGGNGGASEGCCVDITAPSDGVVLDIDVVSERTVAAGSRLLTIGDPLDLEIVADLLSSDAVRLPAGAEARVERWGGPEPLSARLVSVEPVARTKVSALGIEEQRVDARFELSSPIEDRPGLGHGFSVFLRITEWRGEDIVQVPLSAIFRDAGGWAVFTTANGTADLTPVAIGRRGAMTAEVLEGLTPGQTVIAHPSDAISDGSGIRDRSED